MPFARKMQRVKSAIIDLVAPELANQLSGPSLRAKLVASAAAAPECRQAGRQYAARALANPSIANTSV